MAVDKYFKGKDDQKSLTRTFLKDKIRVGEMNFEVKLTRFLNRNRRVDRDSVIRKREEILTLKTLLKNEFFQSNE